MRPQSKLVCIVGKRHAYPASVLERCFSMTDFTHGYIKGESFVRPNTTRKVHKCSIWPGTLALYLGDNIIETVAFAIKGSRRFDALGRNAPSMYVLNFPPRGIERKSCDDIGKNERSGSYCARRHVQRAVSPVSSSFAVFFAPTPSVNIHLYSAFT